nr:AMP-binding protein [Rhodospirillales bacterium]
MTATATFKAARDFLLAHRSDYATAYAQFRWPDLPRFNWALDWFDAALAQGENAARPALRITGLNAAECSFGALSERSNRVANGLRALGVGRGDRVMVMLGNVAPLWETMLAAMKLGAVVVPATTLLPASDIAERVARATVRAIVVGAEDAGKKIG